MYSEEVELKNGLREHLATTTEALMDELMAMLRNESSTFQLAEGQLGMLENTIPAYDPNVNYISKVHEQSDVLEKVQSLYEDHSQDYLNMLKDVVHSKHIRSYKEYAAQQEALIRDSTMLRLQQKQKKKKRELKLSRKVKKMMEVQQEQMQPAPVPELARQQTSSESEVAMAAKSPEQPTRIVEERKLPDVIPLHAAAIALQDANYVSDDPHQLERQSESEQMIDESSSANKNQLLKPVADEEEVIYMNSSDENIKEED